MTIVTVTETQATVSITEQGATTVVPTVSATGVEVNQAGVPPGGNPKDLLVKSSGTDYHSEWTSTPEVNALQFDLTAGVEPGNGQVVWNADEGTLELGKGNISNYIGQETMVLCRNASNTVTIPKGTAVMFAGLRKLFGLEAEMMGDPVFTKDGRAIERWKLSKINN